MSFNRRGPDRRPDRPPRDRADRPDRQPRRTDWQPRERAEGDRPYPPRDRGGADRPYSGGGAGGGGRPYSPRPRFDRPPDDGAMSIRLDPRRVSTLKQLAADAGVRPGDLVRQWVEERLDAARGGTPASASPDLAAQLKQLTERVAALEAARSNEARTPSRRAEPTATTEAPVDVETTPQAQPQAEAQSDADVGAAALKRPRRNAVSAAPATERTSSCCSFACSETPAATNA